MSQTPEHQRESHEGPAVSPGSRSPVPDPAETDDLAPPFSGRRAGSPSPEIVDGDAGEAPAPEAREGGEDAGELLPDFLDDDEPWAASSEGVATDESATQDPWEAAPDELEAEPWASGDEQEDPWSAGDEELDGVPAGAARQDEGAVDAPDAALEEAARRAADRLEAIARRLRAVQGDSGSLSEVGRDDPLALLVVGFVMGEMHGR